MNGTQEIYDPETGDIHPDYRAGDHAPTTGELIEASIQFGRATENYSPTVRGCGDPLNPETWQACADCHARAPYGQGCESLRKQYGYEIQNREVVG